MTCTSFAAEFRLLLEDRGGGSVLRQVIASSDATVRMRALYLIISVGAMSSEHASLLDHFGAPCLTISCEAVWCS